MKERKQFFSNNRLNKGYKKLSHSLQSDTSTNEKHYRSILPPLEMLEHYEELNPGTINKLLEMARKEQIHRHSIDLLSIKRYDKFITIGRLAALCFISIILTIAIILITYGSFLIAAIFIFLSFSCVTIVSYFFSKKNISSSKFSRYSSSKSKH